MKLTNALTAAAARLPDRIKAPLDLVRHMCGRPVGNLRYRYRPKAEADSLPVYVLVRGDGPTAVSEVDAVAWCSRQTLDELALVAKGNGGREFWRVPSKPRPGRAPTWFAAPGRLPTMRPEHLESCFLVAAAEAVDAVVLVPTGVRSPTHADEAHSLEHRPWTLYRSDAYRWDSNHDAVIPTRTARLVKVISDHPQEVEKPTSAQFNRFRRGAYLSSAALPRSLVVDVQDASEIPRVQSKPARPAVLVTVPFLARGGAEQTLLATMQALRDRLDFSIATLAPHRSELGDRRDEFRAVTDRIYCLGDLVHPDVMVGILLSILDSTGSQSLYNANGTTLFYDFAPRLKAERPGLRIVDHLYDHRVGYVEEYDPTLMSSVDACVAENHAIARELVDNRGWSTERVPVIWPCGRAESELPAEPDRGAIRQRVREELGFADDDVVFLTAARMHEQKRPLDLVALAERVLDLASVRFLIVGGGDLESRVDAAISASRNPRIRRLPFRDDVPDLIVAADVGCLVSEFEGLPVFLLECLQLGRPFLGTRVGDLGTVIDDTGAGLVVDRPGDLDALEAAVRRLAVPEIRAAAAQRALEAAPRFGVASCARAYERVILGVD